MVGIRRESAPHMVSKFLGSLLPVLLLGCAVDQPELSSTAGNSFEEFKAQARREPGTNNYVVDWDTVLHGDDELLEFYYRFQQGGLAIDTAGGVDVKWSATQKKQLTYCVSNSFGTRKQAVIDAMKAASDNGWEKLADVNFTYVPGEDATCTAQNANVLFDVNPITGADYLARSFFPNDARANRNVIIDANAFDPAQTNNISLGNILGHELGHTLGFRHEHIRPEANATQCVEDNQFRALTTYDSASVMHYPQCNGTGTTLAFTTRDQQGVVAVYGAPVANMAPTAQLTAPTNGATVGPTFAVEAAIVDTDVSKAELSIDGAVYQTVTAAPFTFQVTALALGSHTLEIKATDSQGQTAVQTITVTVAKNGGNGTGGGGSGSGTGDGEDDAITGGCSTGGAGASLLVGIGLIAGLRRRRAA